MKKKTFAVYPGKLKTRFQSGFTLIELLVVVLIIGILSAVALPQYQLAVDKARLMSILPFGRTMKDSAERYFLANGDYPPGVKDLDVDVPANCTKQDVTYYARAPPLLVDPRTALMPNLGSSLAIYSPSLLRLISGAIFRPLYG